MSSWAIFAELQTILITYYFGSAIAYYLAVLAFCFLGMVMVGLDIRVAFVAIIPLIGAMAADGWFGGFEWIIGIALIIAALFYGYAILRLFT